MAKTAVFTLFRAQPRGKKNRQLSRSTSCTSITFVPVGPVTKRPPAFSKKWYESFSARYALASRPAAFALRDGPSVHDRSGCIRRAVAPVSPCGEQGNPLFAFYLKGKSEGELHIPSAETLPFHRHRRLPAGDQADGRRPADRPRAPWSLLPSPQATGPSPAPPRAPPSRGPALPGQAGGPFSSLLRWRSCCSRRSCSLTLRNRGLPSFGVSGTRPRAPSVRRWKRLRGTLAVEREFFNHVQCIGVGGAVGSGRSRSDDIERVAHDVGEDQ